MSTIATSATSTPGRWALDYQPVTAFRLRATHSIDIRAPQIFELYGAGTVLDQHGDRSRADCEHPAERDQGKSQPHR